MYLSGEKVIHGLIFMTQDMGKVLPIVLVLETWVFTSEEVNSFKVIKNIRKQLPPTHNGCILLQVASISIKVKVQWDSVV